MISYDQLNENSSTLNWKTKTSLVRHSDQASLARNNTSYILCLSLDFFGRKIRPMDNFACVKGTEVRNLLFYGLLPHLDSSLPHDQYAHLAMYICGICLLHSGNLFGDATSTIARRLFAQFHQDHEWYYNRLQNFKLHMHCHYASMFDSHGSLCNLGCFGQESFIGSISANYHGTRNYGDSITYYYNLDFFIHDKKKETATKDGPYDRSSSSVRLESWIQLKIYFQLKLSLNWSFNLQLSTFKFQPSTFNLQLSTETFN